METIIAIFLAGTSFFNVDNTEVSDFMPLIETQESIIDSVGESNNRIDSSSLLTSDKLKVEKTRRMTGRI